MVEPKVDDATQSQARLEHLRELPRRIVWAAVSLAVGMGIALAFGQQILRILTEPLIQVFCREVLEVDCGCQPVPISMTMALYVGILIAAPWMLHQCWLFISAGLPPKQRERFRASVLLTTGLYYAGAVFFLNVVAVPLFRLSKHWQDQVMGIRALITLQAHIEFMATMMLFFGLCFQMPAVILALAKAGLTPVKTLNHYRRHVIVAILVFAAVLTPTPNPLDLMSLAIPMWLLYELGVVLSYFLIERRRRRA